ncbi:MAG: class IV adenylate cyclase [Anaerolineaceae bacterium]|nr:class IV adenylate cyclase [Anaerolineaceae bacterium]
MNGNDNHEIEVKFAISSVEELIPGITALGAKPEQPTQLERNLRWDDRNGTLSTTNQVLRLRDNGGTSVLTYKAGRQNDQGLADREEIETVVTDFDNTCLILERLGYEIVFIYEKYRSIYSLNNTGLFVDHTPIGDFIEIEGPDGDAIRASAELLGLNWEERIDKGYRALFEQWKKQTGYPGRDMVFRAEP